MKKAFYVLMCMVLLTLLSFIAHLLLAVVPVSTACIASGFLFGSLCVLPVWALYSIPLSGIVAGYLLGQMWWRIIYIEHRHWRKHKM